MEIRRAQRADLSEIYALIKLSARELQSGFYEPCIIEEALELVTGIDGLIEAETFLVVVDAERIVGCGGYVNSPMCSELRALFVHPRFSRKGIASKVMAKCIELCVGTGSKQLKLVATLAGVPFYTKFGFSEISRETVTLSSGALFEVVAMNR